MANLWTDHKFEPKQNFKWLIDLGYEQTSFLVTSAAKPNFEVQTKKFRNLNIEENYFGNVVWAPITIEFIDTVENDTLLSIKNYFLSHGFNLGSSLTEYEGFAKKDLNDPMKIHLKGLDSEGKIIEHWVLQNCVPQKLEMSPFQYSNEDLSKYKLTIAYEWAYIENFKELSPPQENLDQQIVESTEVEAEVVQQEQKDEAVSEGNAQPQPSVPVQQSEKIKDTQKNTMNLLEQYSLKGGPRLRQGSKGDAVRQLQEALGIEVDGVWGKDTSKALRKYQRKNGINPRGIFGPKTFKALMEGSAVPKK